MIKIAHNELFAIRDGESAQVYDGRPESGTWIAVMARSLTMPDGPKQPVRHSDGAPVEQAAIVGCFINSDGLWQWLNLSPATKETIGDLLFDNGCAMDRWYYVALAPLAAELEAAQ